MSALTVEAGRRVLSDLPPQDRIDIFHQIVEDSFLLLRQHQFRNGLIPATIGRHDDHHFADNIWVKDAIRAVQFVNDPNFQQTSPDLVKPARRMYLNAVQGLLKIQTNPQQWQRFDSRPEISTQDGYYTIPDPLTPAIKFTSNGEVFHDWGHNQPDNWGILLLEAGKGIEVGLPVLKARDFEPGLVLAKITSYVARLHTERFDCRSIWEKDTGHSSYSTRRMVLAGLEEMDQVWDKLVEDSAVKGYKLPIQRTEVVQAAKSLRAKVREQTADYTDPNTHPFASDLASLIVLNDIVDLPVDEQDEIRRRIAEGELENTLGFFRWVGDDWKRNQQGQIEAKWTMGKPIMARDLFTQAIDLAQSHDRAPRRKFDHGIDRMQHIIDIIDAHGYFPELFEHDTRTDTFKPNNNDLAWNRSYLIEAASAGIVAQERLTS